MATDLVVMRLDRAKAMLMEAKDLQQAKNVADISKAAEVLAKEQKSSDEIIYYAQEIRVFAERRMGEILKETPRNEGAKGIGTSAVPKENRTPTYSDMGIDKKQASRAQKLASIPEEEVKAAIEDAKQKEEPVSPAKILEKVEKKETVYTFNETNNNIEWAKWSWNPVTGCKTGCKYCYARDIAMRFYGTFEPKFWPDRLSAPSHTKNNKTNEPGGNNVFLCSMADLWGPWVPDEWITKVLAAVNAAPQWNFLALTKWPKRYLAFDLPKNLWCGATTDTEKRMDAAVEAFESIENNITFISSEPMMQPIRIPSTAHIDWVIIGGRSRSTGMPEGQPEWQWVVDLVDDAKSMDAKVYLKPNLRPLKEFPV